MTRTCPKCRATFTPSLRQRNTYCRMCKKSYDAVAYERRRANGKHIYVPPEPRGDRSILVGSAITKCPECGTSLTAFDARMHLCNPHTTPIDRAIDIKAEPYFYNRQEGS